MPCLPWLNPLKLSRIQTLMNLIKFFVNPGDEAFAPCVIHSGEDAGADIRAYVKDEYNRGQFEEFYKKFKKALSPGGNCDLFIDGVKYEFSSLDEFLEVVENTGGGVILKPGETKIVNGGFKVVMSKLDELGAPWNSLLPVYKIVSRSGLACKHGIVVANAPGIVDSGYQDWVKVGLSNRGTAFHVFTHGARIAQGLHEFVFDQSGSKVTSSESVFNPTLRNLGGFGSTNVSQD